MLTDERIDVIFTQMDGYILELANDPNALGPSYFQDIIATCRNYLNRVSLVISELNREKLTVSSELRRLESSYAVEYDNLLANDERVKALASIDDRKATVGFLLKDQKLQINDLKDRMHALDAVSKVVAHRNKELHSTMTAIKDQRRLMQTEIATGAFYGDERVPKAQRPPREPNSGMGLDNGDDDFSVEELEAMLSDSKPEGDSNSKETPQEENLNSEVTAPEEEAPSEDAEVIKFIESSGEEETQKTPPVVGGEKGDSEDIGDMLSMLEGL